MKKRRLLCAVLVVCLMVAVFVFCLPTEVKAETHDIYTYTVENGEATITKCKVSASGHIAVPDKLGGYPVTTIGNSAFWGCNELEVITLPEGLKNIEASAFGNCSKLIKLNVPDSIEYIASSAFHNCNNLTYNTFDNGTYLGNSKNLYVVLKKATSKTITTCQIHENTKVIFASAFFDCSGLRSISIPENVKSIGENAFYRCTSLKTANIPNSVNRISGKAFATCTSLTGIVIPGNVTTIGTQAFIQCRSLASITVPEGVTHIGKEAFSYSGIKDIVLPKSLTMIEEGAFYSCGISNVYYKGTQEQWEQITIEKYMNENLLSAICYFSASGCIHKWDEGAVTKEANCVETGAKTYTCTICQEKRIEELPVLTTHTYQHDCDTDCDICHTVREITHKYDTAWRADETGHFYECTVCGDKKDIAAHTPGAAPTETAPQTCTICGYVLVPALGAPDPTEPEPTEPEPTKPEPTKPDPTEPEPTEPEPTEPEPTAPAPTQPKPGEDKGGDLWVTIFVAVAIIAAAALGIWEVALMRKKRK